MAGGEGGTTWRQAMAGAGPALALALAGLLAAQTGARAAPDDGPGPLRAAQHGLTVHELTDLAQLQARFNADFGKPRLLLLLSPT